MFGLVKRNPELRVYDPFREMEEMERAFFGRPFGSFFSTAPAAQFRTDITDEGDHYLLEADLPGFDKKDIRLELQDDVLRIHAQRNARVEEKDRKDRVIRMERSYGSYNRSFNLSGVNTADIRAKYENGVLRLTLPKQQLEIPKARQLEIE